MRGQRVLSHALIALIQVYHHRINVELDGDKGWHFPDVHPEDIHRMEDWCPTSEDQQVVSRADEEGDTNEPRLNIGEHMETVDEHRTEYMEMEDAVHTEVKEAKREERMDEAEDDLRLTDEDGVREADEEPGDEDLLRSEQSNSGFVGVQLTANGKRYAANVFREGRVNQIGTFLSAVCAARARKDYLQDLDLQQLPAEASKRIQIQLSEAQLSHAPLPEDAMLERSSQAASGYVGVYILQGKFRARVMRNGTYRHLGTFDHAVVAARARREYLAQITEGVSEGDKTVTDGDNHLSAEMDGQEEGDDCSGNDNLPLTVIPRARLRADENKVILLKTMNLGC